MDLDASEKFPKLRLGDIVYLTGKVYTMRDKAIKRSLSEEAPCGKRTVVYHCGPLVRKIGGAWEVLSAGPTTSSRMNNNTPAFVWKYEPKAIIGKGGMNKESYEAMEENDCIYLLFTGGCGALAASKVKRVVSVDWLELGTAEAVWQLEFEKFGPLVVAATGGKFFRQ
ncbi:MAG: FumA C-terminus/TtdB family hydratase beta subunit [Candidatus Micrarchaeota archaeon]|nr:FumA C-terminus/TtdB family hydratase beta subunit [Candidatus Micrarchaeota archaeon]